MLACSQYEPFLAMQARFEDEISQDFKELLDGLVDYFGRQRCDHCFSPHTRHQIMQLV